LQIAISVTLRFSKQKSKTRFLKTPNYTKPILRECDLTGSLFDNCDLAGATFDNTNLEKADFTTAFNYLIDPDTNRIKKAKFALPGVLALLNKHDIVIVN
jgi:fluoroquinolone resistance protein